MSTYVELQKQIAELMAKAEALKSAERNGVIERMKEAIAVYDITAAELGLNSSRANVGASNSGRLARAVTKATKVDAAYKDRNGNSWSGRGPRPKWLKEALAQGASLEHFAVYP